MVPKLKTELAEFTSSLKATLDAMEAFKEKGRQENIAAKEKAEVKEREKTYMRKWRSVNPLCWV